MLHFADGTPFTGGARSFVIRPATTTERYGRLVLDVQIEGFQTEAMLDTGGIFVVCRPEMIEQPFEARRLTTRLAQWQKQHSGSRNRSNPDEVVVVRCHVGPHALRQHR
jgi:hypothetical protein